jgi:hypothetical protein
MELMSEGQWKRWDAVARLAAGKLTMDEAARVLKLSVRQVRRIRRQVEQAGRQGLVHANTGRVPVNKLKAAVRTRLLRLRRTKYAGFNDHHFAEKLAAEVPALTAAVSTVRRVLRADGIAAVRGRRPPRHRKRRDRKAQAGLMLLWDGSRHDWLEGRGPWLCLVGAIDDATSDLLPGAHFVAQECAAAYLQLLRTIVAECGVPWSIYMDQHGALKRNDDHWTWAEEQRGAQDPTQVGQALQALEVTAIYALSPQAKGRVERQWGTLQDRLVSELRLAGARTVTEANAILAGYRLAHNRRFAVAPQDRTPAWRSRRPGVDLDRVCSFRYEATVLKDNTVRLGGTIVLDIPPGPRGRSYAGTRVEVRHLLDGSWRVYASERLIATGPVTTHGELRTLRRRKCGRGAAQTPPEHAAYAEAAR